MKVKVLSPWCPGWGRGLKKKSVRVVVEYQLGAVQSGFIFLQNFWFLLSCWTRDILDG